MRVFLTDGMVNELFILNRGSTLKSLSKESENSSSWYEIGTRQDQYRGTVIKPSLRNSRFLSKRAQEADDSFRGEEAKNMEINEHKMAAKVT